MATKKAISLDNNTYWDSSTIVNENNETLDGMFSGNKSMGNIVVDSIRSKNIARNVLYSKPTDKYGEVAKATYSLEAGKTYTISFDTTNTNISVYRQTPANIGFSSLEPYSVVCDGTRKSFTGVASATATYFNKEIITRLSDTSSTPVVISNLMIEEGSFATDYFPYQELNNQEVYSTNEMKIGTWIDGKPLYRKTLYFENNGGGTGQVSYTLSNYGITNVDSIFIVQPSYYSNTLNGYIYPFVYNDGSAFECGVNKTTLNVRLGYAPISNSPFVITLEYTKTTD